VADFNGDGPAMITPADKAAFRINFFLLSIRNPVFVFSTDIFPLALKLFNIINDGISHQVAIRYLWYTSKHICIVTTISNKMMTRFSVPNLKTPKNDVSSVR